MKLFQDILSGSSVPSCKSTCVHFHSKPLIFRLPPLSLLLLPYYFWSHIVQCDNSMLTSWAYILRMHWMWCMHTLRYLMVWWASVLATPLSFLNNLWMKWILHTELCVSACTLTILMYLHRWKHLEKRRIMSLFSKLVIRLNNEGIKTLNFKLGGI